MRAPVSEPIDENKSKHHDNENSKKNEYLTVR